VTRGPWPALLVIARAILHSARLARSYPRARLARLGDSEALVFERPVDLQTDYRAHDNFPSWIPAVAAIEPGRFSMADFYAAVARAHPGATFAQVNTAHDSVQIRYFLAAGDSSELGDEGPDPTDDPGASPGSHAVVDEPAGVAEDDPNHGRWEAALVSSLERIRARAPNFRSWLAAGHEHCILPLDRFYTLEEEGVTFREWVAALAGGREVADVGPEDLGQPMVGPCGGDAR